VAGALWLDLGAGKNLADVSLNRKDFGVLWKPPSRVNVTAAAKPGVNQLVDAEFLSKLGSFPRFAS